MEVFIWYTPQLYEARTVSTTHCTPRTHSAHFLRCIIDSSITICWIKEFNPTNNLSSYYVPGGIINFNKNTLLLGSRANKSKPYNSEAGSIIPIWAKEEPVSRWVDVLPEFSYLVNAESRFEPMSLSPLGGTQWPLQAACLTVYSCRSACVAMKRMRVAPFPSLSQSREVHTSFPPPRRSHRIMGENVEDSESHCWRLGWDSQKPRPGAITSSLVSSGARPPCLRSLLALLIRSPFIYWAPRAFTHINLLILAPSFWCRWQA